MKFCGDKSMGGGGKHIKEQVFPFDTPNFKKILKMMRWP